MEAEKDIFCKIIDKEVPSKMIAETENWIAIYDIKPAANVHALIIPKKHGSLSVYGESDAGLLGSLILAARQIAQQLEIQDTGYRLVVNYGNDSGADVKDHLHIHLLGGENLGGKIVSKQD